MPSDAQRKAAAKYHSGLDEMKIRVPKGDRERYKAHAAARGTSLTALIVRLLEADIAALESEKNHID